MSTDNKPLTKENFLNKKDLVFYMGGGEDEVQGSLKDVEWVMDEWGKYNAIGFLKWKWNNDWCEWDYGFVHAETEEIRSCEELYELYVKERENLTR